MSGCDSASASISTSTFALWSLFDFFQTVWVLITPRVFGRDRRLPHPQEGMLRPHQPTRLRNPYFHLVSEDPMMTESPNQANEQVFRRFRTCFSVENSQIIQQQYFVYQNKIRNSYRGVLEFLTKSKIPGFFY